VRHRIALLLASIIMSSQPILARDLDLEERVAAQRAIERVFWAHRIWPEGNAGPKPPLEQVLPESVLRARVDDALRMSSALERFWGQGIRAADLRDEIERMAAHTGAPEVLRELFAALGDDPFLIAEILARPIVAERRLYARYQDEAPLLAEPQRSFESWWDALRALTTPEVAPPSDDYDLTPLLLIPCAKDTWTPVNNADVVGKPSPRHYHTAVWTGTEMIIWGGRALNPPGNPIYLGDGGRYVPATDTWVGLTGTGAPVPRVLHGASWSGTEMIVWGGASDTLGLLNTGGRYNPTSNTWVATSIAGAPSGRANHTQEWVGSTLVVWGGLEPSVTNTGGRYSPVANSWSATTTSGAPTARRTATSVRSGPEVIFWGGDDNAGTTYATGGHYNPTANVWMPTTVGGAPAARSFHTAVWTGDRMIVWGGGDNSGLMATGGRYDVTGDPPQWSATSTTNAATSRQLHTAVWTGCEMVIWGGYGIPNPSTNQGGRYDPALDRWLPTWLPGAPSIRYSHVAAFSGSEMVVWGGTTGAGDFGDGARYCACPCPLTAFSGIPTIRFATQTTVTWTGLAGATHYDLVRGDLGALRASGGNFATATNACPGENVPASPTIDGTAPAPGAGLYYVLRGADRCSASNGTYDTGTPQQVGLRDAEVGAAPGTCQP